VNVVGVEIGRLEPEEVLGPRLAEITEVWTWTDERRVKDILPRHAERDGFRFLAAHGEDGRLVGFVYGYLGAPGQWWHDIVAAEMDEQRRGYWLQPGHFELVELHVRLDYRRRGVGARLHDAVLEGLESPTAVLSTQRDNKPALTLYQRRGWGVIVPRLRFSPGGETFSILGLELSARNA
jgi:ribosomal protein S18 acetylase RimI-like enzyme